jgi:hypothetical protein
LENARDQFSVERPVARGVGRAEHRIGLVRRPGTLEIHRRRVDGVGVDHRVVEGRIGVGAAVEDEAAVAVARGREVGGAAAELQLLDERQVGVVVEVELVLLFFLVPVRRAVLDLPLADRRGVAGAVAVGELERRVAGDGSRVTVMPGVSKLTLTLLVCDTLLVSAGRALELDLQAVAFVVGAEVVVVAGGVAEKSRALMPKPLLPPALVVFRQLPSV